MPFQLCLSLLFFFLVGFLGVMRGGRSWEYGWKGGIRDELVDSGGVGLRSRYTLTPPDAGVYDISALVHCRDIRFGNITVSRGLCTRRFTCS